MKKKAGFIVTAELVLIATILVIGMMVGLVVVRDAVVNEMDDISEAIGDMNQSFTLNGVESPENQSLPVTSGMQWQDGEDTEAGDDLGQFNITQVDFVLAPPAGEYELGYIPPPN